MQLDRATQISMFTHNVCLYLNTHYFIIINATFLPNGAWKIWSHMIR